MLKIHFSPLNVIFLILAAHVFQNIASACELTMGYRTSERLPLIQKAPNNSGLYQRLYTVAAEKIGCTLKVVRGPKKRILNGLYHGKIDFYPGFNFSALRAQSVFYIENGLPGGDIGISRADLDEVTDLAQLKGLTYITALGSTNFVENVSGVSVRKIRELTVDRAILLIQKKRGDFYIYNRASLKFYLTANNITNMTLHPNCCGGTQPLYLGFSKKSPYYQAVKNPMYRSQQTLSTNNFPTVLAPTSIAYQFQQALKQLQITGVTKKLYAQYYQ
jgi:hypothetical protein